MGGILKQGMLGLYSGRKSKARICRILFLYKTLEGGMLTKANTLSQIKGRSRYIGWGQDKQASTMLSSTEMD